MNKTRTSEGRLLQVIFTAVTLLFALLCIVPYILVVIGSFTDESVLTTDGLGFFPTKWSSNAYQVLFADFSRILTGYKITILVTVIGTFLSLLINSMLAYVLSKKNLRFRNQISFYCAFTMLFSGGTILPLSAPFRIGCGHGMAVWNS